MIYDVHGNVLFDPSVFKEEYPFADVAYSFQIASHGSQIQGCCSDGTNLYFGNSGFMCRLNPLTKEKFTKTGLTLYHCNDVAYNPNTGLVYVATMESSGATEGQITCLNASTLEVDSLIFPEDDQGNIVHSSGIAYDRLNDKFILSASHTYAFFDSDWNFERKFTYQTTGTYQGLETDGEYIYRPLSGGGERILVLTMAGDPIKTISMKKSGELEGVAYDWNGNWYDTYVNGTVDYLGMFKYTNYNAVWNMAKLSQ